MSPSASAAVDMHPRLAEEWADILAVHADAEYKRPPERVELTLELEDGRYNHSGTPVGVLIPPGYRTTGPDGFLVPVGLQFADGQPLPASDASGVGMPGWLLVSFHHVDANGVSTWRPTADPRRGDNFIGYVASIESFFARGCN
jgi:hypothetical protein